MNGSNATLNLSGFRADNLAPQGNYAADGVVLLTGGTRPVVNARLSDLVVLNSRQTGEVNNGDSIEIQHRGATDGVLNVDIRRADLRDPASANIKVLEASNPTNGSYDISISDSVLSNANPAGMPDADSVQRCERWDQGVQAGSQEHKNLRHRWRDRRPQSEQSGHAERARREFVVFGPDTTIGSEANARDQRDSPCRSKAGSRRHRCGRRSAGQQGAESIRQQSPGGLSITNGSTATMYEWMRRTTIGAERSGDGPRILPTCFSAATSRCRR